MIEPFLIGAVALAALLVGILIGAVISDYFATKYWNKAIGVMERSHKQEITGTTVASFNQGVLAAIEDLGKGDSDIPND